MKSEASLFWPVGALLIRHGQTTGMWGQTTGSRINIGKQPCQPAAGLQWNNTETGEHEDRTAWIGENCRPLETGLRLEASISEGEYHHYHWTHQQFAEVTESDPNRPNASTTEVEPKDLDYFLETGGDAGRVTFMLIPCTGMPHLFAKPALLGDGLAMNQMFETTESGHHSATWPFPDTTCGEREIDDKDPETGEQVLPPLKWGRSSIRDGFENSITYRITHSGYFVSVYGKTAADYTLMAYTHYGPVNPRQQYHDGDHQIRRKSLQPSWDVGQLTMSWSIDGTPANDKFQLFMTKHPRNDPTLTQGYCGQETDPKYMVVSNATNYTSQCILWTSCGLERNAERVGQTVNASQENGDHVAYDPERKELAVYIPKSTCYMGASNTSGIRRCHLEMNTDYHFTVMRIPGDGSPKEIYQGIETNWSYYRDHVYASGNANVVDGALVGGTGVAFILLLCKRRSKRKVDMKLNAVFKEAMVTESQWTSSATDQIAGAAN